MDVILQKAEKVKEGFVQLHEPLLGQDLCLNSRVDDVLRDFKILLDELKVQIQDHQIKQDYTSEISYLPTLAPSSWSKQQISTFFAVTQHFIKISKILKREKGLFAVNHRKLRVWKCG